MVLIGLVPLFLLDIAAVEFELLGNLGAQLLGGEDDHLVVHLAALTHELHALEQVGPGTTVIVVLGDEHDRLDVIDACGILEIDKRECHAGNERQQE